MPYVDNPICSVPTDENAKTWRYMDFPRFVAMLDRSALFFARADKMADKYEGMLTTPTIEYDLGCEIVQSDLDEDPLT